MDIKIGTEVLGSPVGPGKITGITDAGYPQVNEVAVAWMCYRDERTGQPTLFDPRGQIGDAQRASFLKCS